MTEGPNEARTAARRSIARRLASPALILGIVATASVVGAFVIGAVQDRPLGDDPFRMLALGCGLAAV